MIRKVLIDSSMYIYFDIKYHFRRFLAESILWLTFIIILRIFEGIFIKK